jgi:hypothetical protein
LLAYRCRPLKSIDYAVNESPPCRRARAWVNGMPNDKSKKATYQLTIPPILASTTSSSSSQTLPITCDNPTPSPPLEIVQYEAAMFFRACDVVLRGVLPLPEFALFFRNAVVEDAVLHARSLCEVFLDETDENQGGIRVWRLVEDKDWRAKPECKDLRDRIGDLKDKYNGVGRGGFSNSPRRAFNQMVMHSTIDRGPYYHYREPLSDIESAVRNVITELERLTQFHFRTIG